MGDDLNDVLDAVGPRLRALRRRRRITLAELSATTGISESTLSRLESGKRRANLDLLLPLARAYGVPLDDLVGAPHTGDPRVHLRPIHRGGMTFIPLTWRAGGVQAYKMIIPARRDLGQTDPQTHEGYEWLFVLNGRLRLILADVTWSCPPDRRLSSTPTSRTGSAPPIAPPWSCSSCSASRANAPT